MGLGGMTEKGARFMDFKTQAERGLEVIIHKIKWPKMAAALHRAAGLDANETLKTGVAGMTNSSSHHAHRHHSRNSHALSPRYHHHPNHHCVKDLAKVTRVRAP